MEFTKEDFSKIPYKVFNKEPILERYPDLYAKYIEFREDFSQHKLSTDMVHRYALLMYQDTILNTIQKLNERKLEAARLVGFEMIKYQGKNKFKKEVEDLLNCNLPEGNALFLRVCKLSKNQDYTDLMMFSEALDRQRLMMIEDKMAKDVSLIIKNIDELRSKVDTLTKKITNEEVKLEPSLYESITNDCIGKPEEIVQAIKDGTVDKLIVNPYE